MKYEFDKGTEFPIKRFYLPNLQTEPCPTCETLSVYDNTQEYISYPVQGEKEAIPYYCNKCDEHFEVKKVFKVTVSLEDG